MQRDFNAFFVRRSKRFAGLPGDRPVVGSVAGNRIKRAFISSCIQRGNTLVEVDGLMINTRADGWKAIKLGRLFKSSDCSNPNSASSCLTASQYVGHFGKSEDFRTKAEQVIESYGQLRNR
jgi:hypothetical protein